MFIRMFLLGHLLNNLVSTATVLLTFYNWLRTHLISLKGYIPTWNFTVTPILALFFSCHRGCIRFESIVGALGRQIIIFELKFVLRFLEFLLQMNDLVSIKETEQDGLLTLIAYLPGADLHERSFLVALNRGDIFEWACNGIISTFALDQFQDSE